LSPTCDCSRNIATPCYRLRGVGNRRSAGIVRLRHHGPRIRAMNGSSENAAIRRRTDRRGFLCNPAPTIARTCLGVLFRYIYRQPRAHTVGKPGLDVVATDVGAS
jgi:hypothetical protein